MLTYFPLILVVLLGLYVLMRGYFARDLQLLVDGLIVLACLLSTIYIMVHRSREDRKEPVATKEDIGRLANIFAKRLVKAKEEGRKLTMRVIIEEIKNAETEMKNKGEENRS